MEHTIAITIAFILDQIFGDPKRWPHPVKGLGYLIHQSDRWLNRGKFRKLNGFMMVIVLSLFVFVVSLLIIYFMYQIHPLLGLLTESWLIYTTIAQKSLKQASLDVYRPLKQKDINLARKKLAEIVSRDTNQLRERDIVRGTIETVAENTSDGITAPLFWAFIGGAPLAFVYRFVNTCDSMVGYQSERYKAFGYASAKFDDALNYIPARLTALVMVITNKTKGDSFKTIWHNVRIDAKKTASPNSGWLEASVAYLLHIKLGGTNIYEGKKVEAPILGGSQKQIAPLQIEHIQKTIRIMEKTVMTILLLIILGGIIIDITYTWF